MSVALGLRLLASGAVRRTDIEAALLAHTGQGVSFIRALLDAKAIDENALEHELAHSELPFLRTVMPIPVLAGALPRGLSRRLLAVPVRQDPYTGTVDVAVVDPFEPHIAEELSFHLGMGVRIVRASLASIEDALIALEQGEVIGASPWEAPSPFSAAEPSEVAEEAVAESGQDIPPTSRRGPFSPNAPRPPFAELSPFVERIRRARDRDGVVDGLLRGMQTIAHRVGVLAIRRGELAGWACNAELGDIEEWREMRIPLSQSPAFKSVMASGSYLGPLSSTGEDAPLLAVMKEATADVSLVIIEVRRRPVLLLLADELGDTLLATRRAARLAEVAGEALAKLIRSTSAR